MKSLHEIQDSLAESVIGDVVPVESVRNLVLEAYLVGCKQEDTCDHTWHKVYKECGKEGSCCMACGLVVWYD